MCITPNKANLSIIGAYNYDSTLFDNLHLPEDVNRETVVSNILDYCAELELLYPDLPYLKNAIGYWSAKELPFWEKVREMETADYNPIENYDRYDNEVETTDRAHDRNANNVVSGTTNTTGKDISVDNGYNRDMVAGYNSENLTVNGETRSNNTSNANTESETKGETAQLNTEKGKENENRVKSLHSHGNIGVTTV
ncbi:MAG: hypothetical protein UHE86_06790, partial [Acutalibacteraceae bacterium]|nr:hypothetical protein [Acutalibacteraceae bacterium]